MARSDYDHWNEEADQIWWMEEGRHDTEAPEICDMCGGFAHLGYCDYDEDDEDWEVVLGAASFGNEPRAE